MKHNKTNSLVLNEEKCSVCNGIGFILEIKDPENFENDKTSPWVGRHSVACPKCSQ
jgi:RecJ-like exonuclease